MPTEDDWWPLEREVRNVAVLEKVQAGLRQSAPLPIYVPAKRTTRLDCLRCLYAFSTAGRQSRVFDGLATDQKVAVSTSLTRLRKCYGWTLVRGEAFMAMNDIIETDDYAAEKGEGSASYLKPDQDYFAIVYEYIPERRLELNAVQAQLDFFYHLGFEPCQGVREKNWQGPGILLDFGDYNSPVDQWFEGGGAYYPRPSAEILVDRANVEAREAQEFDSKAKLRQQGIEPTGEEKRAEEMEQMREHTARAVERGYQWGRRYRSYFDCEFLHAGKALLVRMLTLAIVDREEILKLGLEEDPLAAIRIPAVEPNALRKAWKAYKDQRKEYLVQVLKSSGYDP